MTERLPVFPGIALLPDSAKEAKARCSAAKEAKKAGNLKLATFGRPDRITYGDRQAGIHTRLDAYTQLSPESHGSRKSTMAKKDTVGKKMKIIKLQDEPSVPIIVTTPLVGSGEFIRMSESGTLPTVSPLVLKHKKVGERLAITEAKLRACNAPETISEFQQYCEHRHRDFILEFKNLVKRFEDEKVRLRMKLRKIEEQMSQTNPSLAEFLKDREYPAPLFPISLVPKPRPQRPEIALRNKLIAENWKRKAKEICRILDDELTRDGETPHCMPAGWIKKYNVASFVSAYRHSGCRNLVGKLISDVKRETIGLRPDLKAK